MRVDPLSAFLNKLSVLLPALPIRMVVADFFYVVPSFIVILLSAIELIVRAEAFEGSEQGAGGLG